LFWLDVLIGPAVAVALIIWQWPALLMAAMVFSYQLPNDCEQRDALTRTPSPDGAWDVAVLRNVCIEGPFVTRYSLTVELIRPGEAYTARPAGTLGTVLEMDVDSGPPGVRWTGPRNIEITMPHGAQDIREQDKDFRDVTITYRDQ
jgi:hypothetical protein